MAISEELQKRIAGFTGDMTAPTKGQGQMFAPKAVAGSQLMGMQPKGAISNKEMELFQQASPTNLITLTNGQDTITLRSNDPQINQLIESGYVVERPANTIINVGQTKGAISDSEMQLLQQAEAESGAPFTAEEREMALAQIKQLSKQGEAPYFEQAQQLASFGTGSDTELAHVEPGEVIVPSEFLEDPEFESVLEKKFNQFGIPPEAATVGGLPSLNAQTGMGEYGIFKKIGKFLKKVVTPIAKVAQFVPGPWQVPAALISKAATVRDVVRGDANPLALLSVAGPTAVGGTFGENIAGLKAAGDGSILKGLGSLGGKTLSGIGNAVMNPMEAIRGIPSLLGSATMSGQPRGQVDTDRYELRDLGDQEIYFDKQTGQYLDGTPTNQGGFSGILSGGGADGEGNYGVVGDVLGGMTDRMGITNYGTGTGTGTATGGLGGLAGLAGAGALAGTLGKLAYDETKKDKGVQMTPLTSMDATGRYNIEAEIARRMGQQAPNPTEFGLLPANTFPELSGGKPMQARYGGEVMNYAGGGSPYPNKGLAALAEVAPEVVERMGFNMGGQVMPMAYAEGGNVAMEDFNRMNGVINGEGTETSDEIPAMLSDGEFVMTGQAVRGAGKYEMQAGEGGIMTLIPSLDEDRERGTNLMYNMMEAFAGQAVPSQEQA